MATTTSNTAVSAELNTLLHEYYAVGKRITDMCSTLQISNTALAGICSEIKGARATTNTTHVGILLILAGI